MTGPMDLDSLLTGGNAAFLSELFGRYLHDPAARSTGAHGAR